MTKPTHREMMDAVSCAERNESRGGYTFDAWHILTTELGSSPEHVWDWYTGVPPLTVKEKWDKIHAHSAYGRTGKNVEYESARERAIDEAVAVTVGLLALFHISKRHQKTHYVKRVVDDVTGEYLYFQKTIEEIAEEIKLNRFQENTK